MAKIYTTIFGELALLPYPAEAPVTESLFFLTDIMESYRGDEQRISLRGKPRQSLSYSIPIQSWYAAEAFNTAYGAIRDKWAVPIWTEAQNIGNIASGALFIPCNTEHYDIRPSSLVMVFCSNLNWQILEVNAVTELGIEVTTESQAAIGAWLLPVRIGRVVDNITNSTNGHNSILKVKFDIVDNPLLEGVVPQQYKNNDVYLEPGLKNGGRIDRELLQKVDISDFSLGPVSYRTPWDNARLSTPYLAEMDTMESISQFKKWIFRRAGKFREFWQPTFEVNIRVKNVGTVITTLILESDSYIDYAKLRTHIAFKLNDGTWEFRQVSNPIQVGYNTIQCSLDTPLNVHSSSITYVSYLGLNRLDTDRVEFTWSGAGVASCQIRILELKP